MNPAQPQTPYEAFSPDYLPPQDTTKHSGNIWIFIVVAVTLGALIIGLVWLLNQTHKVFTQGGDSTAPERCSTKITGLPKPPTVCCKVTNTGDNANDRYDDNLKLIISPADPPFYNTVCSQFCSETGTFDPVNNTCSHFDTEANRQYFNNCLAATKPQNCTGPSQPVAVDASGTPFYAQRASLSGCMTTACPSS